MTTIKKYTKEDYLKPHLEGIIDVLPIELPFVQLKRGENTFEVGGAKYKIIEGTYEKELYNRIGKAYFQQQKCYGVELISGKEKYLLTTTPNEFTGKTKKRLIESVNTIIKNSVYKIAQEKGYTPPESYEYKDFLDDFKNRSDEEKIMILQNQIEAMSNGLNKREAFADAYGYELLEGKYVDKDYLKEKKEAAMRESISKQIRGIK